MKITAILAIISFFAITCKASTQKESEPTNTLDIEQLLITHKTNQINPDTTPAPTLDDEIDALIQLEDTWCYVLGSKCFPERGQNCCSECCTSDNFCAKQSVCDDEGF